MLDMSIDNFLRDAWLDGCEKYDQDELLQEACVGNHGNFRVSAATIVFFAIAAVAAVLKPTANREAWPAKYAVYFILVGIIMIIPSEPLFSRIFLNIARSK